MPHKSLQQPDQTCKYRRIIITACSFCNRPGDLPISYGHPPKAWPTDSPKNPYGSEPIPIRACTFEAPLVGNKLYADAFTREDLPGLSMVRIVNKGDLVPQVRQLCQNCISA